jgi:anaerobic magnesium-protoporphyrin IX monomethyl ester cyclase
MPQYRNKVVLYNPKAVFYTMPLALIALASYLDKEKYEVVIVDGRLEEDPIARLRYECKNAICLGISVLTGAPIKDALLVTQKIKESNPLIHVTWGGWHPSLFPEETLRETPADSVVIGQGEITFAEILRCLETSSTLTGVAGIAYRNCNEIIRNSERRLVDINEFPAFDYSLIDVPIYEKLSGRKQIDYISSQGCRFRCNFCADPFMYKRGWYGYTPDRIANELEQLCKKYSFDHVHFQDETFFTSGSRVIAIAQEFIKRRFNFTWFGTMRADQGARLDDSAFVLCKESGLERLMIGLESGSQRMIDWMKKDIKISQVFESAEKCLKHDIAINFSVIIGFPGETEDDMNETLRVVRELRKMSPEFRVSIFYFKPYPGNEIADRLIAEGYTMPSGIKAWSEFDYVMKGSPWIPEKKFREIENFKFYQRLAWSKGSILKSIPQHIAKWRCENANYTFPIEKLAYDRLFRSAQLS